MNRCIRNFVMADKRAADVNVNVVFVAEVIDAVLLYPMGVDIFLATFGFAPGQWLKAFFYVLFFFARIALFWRRNNLRINNLTEFVRKAVTSQISIKFHKQLVGQLQILELFLECPDRFLVGNAIRQGQMQKSHE